MAGSHVIDRLRQLVEGRVAVHLVFGRVEVHRLVARVARDDLVRAHDPDAHALLAPRVDVARHLDRELGVGGVQAAAVLVVEPGLAAHEHFPQRPLLLIGAHAASFIACLFACAVAASRTQAPSSQALTRAARRSRLHGPSPASTRLNSLQSIVPKSCDWRASVHVTSGPGRVTPSTFAWSTVAASDAWRSPS